MVETKYKLVIHDSNLYKFKICYDDDTSAMSPSDLNNVMKCIINSCHPKLQTYHHCIVWREEPWQLSEKLSFKIHDRYLHPYPMQMVLFVSTIEAPESENRLAQPHLPKLAKRRRLWDLPSSSGHSDSDVTPENLIAEPDLPKPAKHRRLSDLPSSSGHSNISQVEPHRRREITDSKSEPVNHTWIASIFGAVMTPVRKLLSRK